jgi:hypothetical protein
MLSTWMATLMSASVMLMSAAAHANISIAPREAIVQDEVVTVTVSNQGTEPEYVSVRLSRLLNPGVPFEEEQLQPISETEQPTIYATPFRLSLAPGQSKVITIRPLSSVSTEQIYRLDVRPEVGKVTTGRSGTVGMIAVKIAHSGLVRQLPERQKESMQVLCVAEGARIVADGNVRYPVKEAKVDGELIEPFNVYPGTPKLLTGKRIAIPGHPVCTSQSP